MSAVVRRKLFQAREHAGGGRASCREVNVTNRFVEIATGLFAVSFFLNFFQHGEEPAEEIGGLSIGWIKHGGDGDVVISSKNRFDRCSAQIVN